MGNILYDMVRFERGQVWVIRFKDQNESKGHEQKKDRPWLVLSTGIYNQTAGMVTCVPITTRDSVETPAQVLFTNARGVKNIILCEQIRSFDYTCGDYIFDYAGTLNEKILEDVDVALSIHLGLHYSPITLNKLYDSMSAVIKSVTYMQTKANTLKFTDEDVLEFATKLEELAVSEMREDPREYISKIDKLEVKDINSEVAASIEESSKEEIEEVSPTPIEPIQEEEISPVENKSTDKRMRWTDEECKAFLEDADSLPMKEVMKKWGISKKTKYYYTKNYVKSKLQKTK